MYNENFESSQRVKKGNVVKRIRNAAISGIVFGLSAGIVINGAGRIGGNVRQSELSSSMQMSTTTDTLSTSYSKSGNKESGNYSVQEIAAQCKSSVVSITCTSVQSVQDFFGGARQYENSSAGSGIVIAKDDENLYVATNNHVVENAKDISVCFNDSEDQVYKAEVKGTDAGNDLAIAAVSLSDIPQDVLAGISIATLGDSDSAQTGEQVVAIGNALGYGQSVTSGYISALARSVDIDGYTASLIQTDAAINPGNSGGALFNMRGEVIGINSAKFSSEEVEGMGYAIPVSVAKPILEQLMTMDKADADRRGSLGISCRDVGSDVSEMYDIPQGAYVDEVENGGAAEGAGIKKGDIITEFDGRAVPDKSSLKNLLEYYEAGDKVSVKIQRRNASGYKEKELEVELGETEGQSSYSGSGQEPDGLGGLFG